MPQDLPGFYYDAEKNRYFPLKSPIPGSSSRPTSSSSSDQNPPLKSTKKHGMFGQEGMAVKVVRMVHVRELCGNSIISNKKKVNFREQYENIRASKPTIWKYKGTERITDAALEHVSLNVQTPDGLVESELLLTGGLNSTFSYYGAGYFGEHAHYGTHYMSDVVQPPNIENQTSFKPPTLWNAIQASTYMPSNVSCIKIPRNHYYPQATDVDSSVSHAIITTLGSETSGGLVYSINLGEPLEYVSGNDLLGHRMDRISYTSTSTIWTADCNSNGDRTVIGTDSGAALIHMESERRSWILRSKSDVLSLQFDCTGNIVLCGLRNGAILTVDTRQKPLDLRDRLLPKHQIPFPSIKTSQSSSGRSKKRENKWFEVRGDVHPTRLMFMPSSVSSLVALRLYDQYFLASSMDGTVRLYDHRLTKKGAVQTYEGNFNSHTHIQMGVDPSERFVMSGGEDFYLRVWRLKSGEMLYEDKFMNSVPSVVCWPRGGCSSRRNHFPGAWLGSREGLFYVGTS